MTASSAPWRPTGSISTPATSRPSLLREDEIYAQIAAHETSGAAAELDLTQVLDEFGARVDRHPTTYRFSFTRHLGDSELIVIDSRAARELTPGERAMLDPDEPGVAG